MNCIVERSGRFWVAVDQAGTHGPFQTEVAARAFASAAVMVPLVADAITSAPQMGEAKFLGE